MNIITIALNDFRVLLKSKFQFAMLLLMPIIMVSMMGYALKGLFTAGKEIQKFKVLYVNQDSGSIGRSFDSFIKNNASDFIEVVQGSIDTAEKEIASGKYPAAIILSQGLSEKYEKGEQAEINVISSGQDEVKDSVISSILNSFAGYSGIEAGIIKSYSDAGKNADTFVISKLTEINNKYGTDFVKTENAVLPGMNRISSFQYFSLSMLLFFVLISGMGVGVGIVTDRSGSIYDRINSYPVRDREYLAGKILGNSILTLFQVFTIIVFTSTVLKVDWGNNYAGLALTIVLIMLLSSSIGLVFSGVVNSPKAVSPVMVITIWTISFIGEAFTPIPALDPIAKFTFYKWGMDSLVNFMTGGNFKDAALDLGLLTITVIILYSAGLILYRRRLSHE